MPPSGERPEDELTEDDRGPRRVDPWPRTAWESESAVEITRPARREAGVDRYGGDDDAGQNVFDGGAGLERLVAHDDRPADETNRTRKASAMPSVICHSSADPALGGDVRGGEQGVAEQGEDRVERRGDEVAKPESMAASMWPVMSNSPGEGWLPLLTLPPLPGAGVVGVVVPPGPT